MALLQLILQNIFSFIVIISFIVFIHEFGHFYIARLCGVKVDEFAIGFGKELFGFNDKKGTRWKFCMLPLGGYVKMYGDRNGASMPDLDAIEKMPKEEKRISFIGKNVYQRMAIVAAGPIANFILAIFIFTILFRINGINTTLPIVEQVIPESAAYEAGLKEGDEILAINGDEIKDFSAIANKVVTSAGSQLSFEIYRGGKILELRIAPKYQVRKDMFGDEVRIPTLGIAASQTLHEELNLSQSFVKANHETYRVSIAVFKALGELITGKRSVKELGGPVKIAQYSGKTVEMGYVAILWFMAMISVNLGVMNLLPVPVLDGGHLFYYLVEMVRRKPLSQKIQQFGFRLGFSMVITLMIFTTFNDIRQLIN